MILIYFIFTFYSKFLYSYGTNLVQEQSFWIEHKLYVMQVSLVVTSSNVIGFRQETPHTITDRNTWTLQTIEKQTWTLLQLQNSHYSYITSKQHTSTYNRILKTLRSTICQKKTDLWAQHYLEAHHYTVITLSQHYNTCVLSGVGIWSERVHAKQWFSERLRSVLLYLGNIPTRCAELRLTESAHSGTAPCVQSARPTWLRAFTGCECATWYTSFALTFCNW